MPKLRRRASRLPRGLEALPPLERSVAWPLGSIMIEGTSEHSDAVRREYVVWPSWAELFRFYARVREQYLSEYGAASGDATPGVELLFQQWVRGAADPALPAGFAQQHVMATAVQGGTDA